MKKTRKWNMDRTKNIPIQRMFRININNKCLYENRNYDNQNKSSIACKYIPYLYNFPYKIFCHVKSLSETH